MKKVLIAEFNSYHDECLYSQIRFLKDAGYAITLVINKQVLERIPEYIRLTKDVIPYDNKLEKKIFKRIPWIYRLFKQILKNEIDAVIFNTASSRLDVILLGHLLKRRVKLFGILHNLGKANHSLSQKIIYLAVKKYFVLNDFLIDSIPIKDTSIRLSSFYPIFFPNYDGIRLIKPKGEIWISIPGKLDFGRRDYYLVTEALQKIKSRKKLKILILGNSNPSIIENNKFLKHIKNHNFSGNFVIFQSFLDTAIFHGYIKKSDYLLIPLKHIGDNYSKHKIMGCYNLAFAYGKNLISPVGLSHITDIYSHSHFYEGAQGLSEVFVKVIKGTIDHKKYVSEKWDFENQKKKYLKFLEN